MEQHNSTKKVTLFIVIGQPYEQKGKNLFFYPKFICQHELNSPAKGKK